MSKTYLVRLGFCSVVAIAVGACAGGGTLRVREETVRTSGDHCAIVSRAVPGIPFYKKRPRIRQETEYRTEVMVVEAVAKRHGGPGAESKPLAPRSVARTQTNREHIDALRQKKHASPADIEAGLDALERPDLSKPGPFSANRFLVDSVIDPVPLYYINGQHPFAGTGKLDVTIANDQTLTNAKGEVDDKTLSTILSVLPIKETLTALVGLAPMGMESVGAPYWTVDLTVTTTTLEAHKLRRELAAGEKLPAPIDFSMKGVEGVEYERELPKAPVPDKGKSFSFEGSVTPPKP